MSDESGLLGDAKRELVSEVLAKKRKKLAETKLGIEGEEEKDDGGK